MQFFAFSLVRFTQTNRLFSEWMLFFINFHAYKFHIKSNPVRGKHFLCSRLYVLYQWIFMNFLFFSFHPWRSLFFASNIFTLLFFFNKFLCCKSPVKAYVKQKSLLWAKQYVSLKQEKKRIFFTFTKGIFPFTLLTWMWKITNQANVLLIKS